MRKVGTILSPECKSYAKDVESVTQIPETIALQLLRLIENLVCQRICEQMLDNKNNDKPMSEPVVVEIPLIGNLKIIPNSWHQNHQGKGRSSLHFDFEFEPLPTFKRHILNIYTTNSCELVSLLSEKYSKILVDSYNNIMEEI